MSGETVYTVGTMSGITVEVVGQNEWWTSIHRWVRMIDGRVYMVGLDE